MNEEPELIELEAYGSYSLHKFDDDRIALYAESLGEETALILNRVEAQQMVANLYKEINKLS